MVLNALPARSLSLDFDVRNIGTIRRDSPSTPFRTTATKVTIDKTDNGNQHWIHAEQRSGVEQAEDEGSSSTHLRSVETYALLSRPTRHVQRSHSATPTSGQAA